MGFLCLLRLLLGHAFAAPLLARCDGCTMLVERFTVNTPNVHRTSDCITSSYDYQTTEVDRTPEGKWVVTPQTLRYEFRTQTTVPKLGYAP